MRTPADKSRLQYRRWTAAKITYLKRNYRRMGDKELAQQISEKVTTDGKVYKLKQIEKKRSYLGLQRTPEELAKIRARNASNGCWIKSDELRAKRTYPEGKSVVVNMKDGSKRRYIKVGSKMVFHNRFLWEQEYGKIPKGFVLRCLTEDKLNPDPDNWELLSMEENARRNSASTHLADGFILSCIAYRNKPLQQLIKNLYPELIQTAKLNYQLNRKIKQHEK